PGSAVIMLLSFESTYLAAQLERRNHSQYLVSGAQEAEAELLLVTGSSDIKSSVVNDTIVQKNCRLNVRGHFLRNFTMKPGAKVIIEGSVAGKIINRGGRLVVKHKAACVVTDGPAEAEACGVLIINLTAIASNWSNLAKRTGAECTAVVKGNAYG